MPLRSLIVGCVVSVCLVSSATAAMYTIENPAGKIRNPAEKMYNPATDVKNPAATIYNPATRMNEPNPISPPNLAVPQPASVPPAAEAEVGPAKKRVHLIQETPQPEPAIPQKNYYLKTAKAYVNAAKRAFVKDDYLEFLAITDDALRRIGAGSLKASNKSRQQLLKYKAFGYGLLERTDE